jgi:chaperonin GroEL
MEAEIEDPYILITDKKISAIADLLPFLEKFVKVSKNLVIIADEIEAEALTTLVFNKLRGIINVLAIKAPGFGDNRKALLEDVAILTGGTLISEDTGRKLESVEVEDLGKAEKVWADKDSSKIIGGAGTSSVIKARILALKKQIGESTSDFDREKLEERLAKLSGGVAVISVGAATEVELNERKERVKDAVGATKAAIEEGIVPGGGVALLTARAALKNVKSEVRDEQIGIDIVRDALEQPLRWLIRNAGEDDSNILAEIVKAKDPDYGYDVITGRFGSMTKFGILDPMKVTRSAIQNAASVAQMVLTTECLVTDIPEEKKEAPAMPGGGMDY